MSVNITDAVYAAGRAHFTANSDFAVFVSGSWRSMGRSQALGKQVGNHL
jgi:hypothetical protein